MGYKIAAVQPLDVQGDVSSALSNIIGFMAQADQQGVAFVCFPECYLQGYTLNKATTKKRAIDLRSRQFQDILAQLTPYQTTIILGIIEKDRTHYYNTAVVISQGKLVGSYRKVNLFEENFSPGTEHTVFKVNGLKFGINICYDARFSEGALEMARKGASVIFYPLSNRWPVEKAKKYRYKHMPNLVDRAIESGCWIVSSDVTYQDAETTAYGCGAIVSPDGDVITRVEELLIGMTSHTIELQNNKSRT